MKAQSCETAERLCLLLFIVLSLKTVVTLLPIVMFTRIIL